MTISRILRPLAALLTAAACVLAVSCGEAEPPEEKKPAGSAAPAEGIRIPLTEPGEETPPAQPAAYWETHLPDGFTLLEQNDRFGLYIETTEFNLALQDTQTGRIWYTSPPYRETVPGITGAGGLAAGSHLVVSYFSGEDQSTGSVNSLVGAVRQKTVTATKIEGGVRFDFDFSRAKEGFRIPLTVTLTPDGLTATVLFDEIEEYTEVEILNIDVLPYFGAGTTADTGWLLLPDGSGTVVEFGSGRQGMDVYSAEVYGRDPALTTTQLATVSEKAMMPLFGLHKNGMSLLAVADQGGGSAYVNATPSGIDNNVLNTAWLSFAYRKADNIVLAEATWTSKDVLVTAPVVSRQAQVSVQYRPLAGEDQQFTGLAAAYRAWLTEERGLQPADTGLPAYLTLYGAVKKEKSFLGIPYTSLVPLTTFPQAQQMAAALGDLGTQELLIRYVGALKGGLDDSVPASLAFEGKLGGNKGMRELLADGALKGYTVYPDVELVRFGQGRLGWSVYNTAGKTLTRTALEEPAYKRSVFFADDSRPARYLLEPTRLAELTASLLKGTEDFALPGISAASLGNVVYSSYTDGKESDKDATAAAFAGALASLQDACGTVLTETGFDFAALQADHILGVPLSDSGYDVSAYRVPFYQMVFSGLRGMASAPLNLSSSYNQQLLLCMETGTAPHYLLTWADSGELTGTAYDALLSTRFADWKEKAAQAWAAWRAVYEPIADRTITAYRMVSDTLRVTGYADGTQVYVNYADSAAAIDGQTVPAMGCLAVRDGRVITAFEA